MATTTITAEPFSRTYEQRMEALKHANEIRDARAKLKHSIKLGAVDLLDVVAMPPVELDTMRLFDLLLAAPNYGPVRVARILARTNVSQRKTVGGLTERQRRELASLMRRQP